MIPAESSGMILIRLTKATTSLRKEKLTTSRLLTKEGKVAIIDTKRSKM